MSYHGPVLIATTAETKLIRDLLFGHKHPTALALIAKCDRVLTSDPRWKEPTR